MINDFKVVRVPQTCVRCTPDTHCVLTANRHLTVTWNCARPSRYTKIETYIALHRIVPADYCDCFVQVVCVQRCGSDRAADHVTECARSPWVETSWEVDHAKEPDSREPFFKFGETCWSCGGKALSGTGIVHGDGESVLAFKQTLKRSSFAPLLSWRPSSSV